MSVELIGLIIAGLAGYGVMFSQKWAFSVLCVAALMQAAAALLIGGTNVTPSILAMSFFALAVIIRHGGLDEVFQTMVMPRAGSILLVLTVYMILSGMFLPRLFAGQVGVYPLANESNRLLVEGPIYPTSSNTNQAVYAIANLVVFCCTAALARTQALLRAVGMGLIVACCANLAFAVIDVVTFQIGQSQLLSFLRNADYAQMYADTFMGMKRITGTFTETSSFSAFTVGLFAYTLRLWRGGIHIRLTGWLSIGLAASIIMATSSTGYVALVVYLIVVYGMALAGIDPATNNLRGFQSRRAMFIALGPMLALMGAVASAFRPELLTPIFDMFDSSVAQKLTSDSGEERMRWNINGLQNFLETFGIGTGLGSTKTSSFVVSVLGKLGIIGTLLFGWFFWKVFRPGNKMNNIHISPEDQQYAAAARSACFALILSLSVSHSTLDLSALFYAFAGLACAQWFEKRPVMRSQQVFTTVPAE